MKSSYEIVLIGCEASTDFTMELTEEEYELLQRVASESVEASTYGCMPTLEVTRRAVDD